MEKIKYPKAVVKNNEPDTVEVDMSKLSPIDPFCENGMKERTRGEFASRGVFLSENYDWVIVKDSENELVLLKLKKN